MFKPKYTVSNKILNQLTQITEIKSIIERTKLLPQREAFLRRTALIKITHTSTSIEGNRLQEYQVEKVAQGKKILAAEDEIKEVKNYLSGLKYIDKLAESKNEFNIKDILKIHRLVTDGLINKEKVGRFRKGPIYIVNVLANQQEKVVYTPPSAKSVPDLIGNLIGWLAKNKEVHPIIRAGLFHYQFETIHPFTDGNGRTGRLITLLHLYQSGWDFKKILVLEDYYNRNRKLYCESLQTGKDYQSRQKVDLTNWLEYYLQGFLEEAKKVKDQVLNLLVVKSLGKSRIILNKDELKIVDFAISIGRITSSDVVDILQIPRRTAQAKLKKLENNKILEKIGAGQATYYVVSR